MQALRGRKDLPSMWTSSVWQQMEATCSQATCLALITQRISEKAGLLVIHPGTVRLVAASSLIRSEAARYSLATRWGCSFRRTAVQRGSQSMKDFRNARSLVLKHRAPITIICLPAPWVRASGENFLIQPHPHRLQLQAQVHLRLQLQLQPRLQAHPQLRLQGPLLRQGQGQHLALTRRPHRVHRLSPAVTVLLPFSCRNSRFVVSGLKNCAWLSYGFLRNIVIHVEPWSVSCGSM